MSLSELWFVCPCFFICSNNAPREQMLVQLDGQCCGGLSGGPGALWKIPAQGFPCMPRAREDTVTSSLAGLSVGVTHRLDRGVCAVPRLVEGLGPHRDISAWGQGAPPTPGCSWSWLGVTGRTMGAAGPPGCHPAGEPGVGV